MNIKEKAAYVKGLFSGMDFDEDKKESKLFKAMVDLMEDMAMVVGDLEEDVEDICEQLEILDEDLAEVEGEVFDESSDEDFYEVICPSCDEKICLSEDTLLEEEMNCPNCGELLEFDLSGVADKCCCGCETECSCEPECDCDCDCDCDK